MPRVEKSALVSYASEHMFSLVDDVERYPEFLPWCGATQLRERTDELTVATLLIDFHGIRQSFTTRNLKHGTERMEIDLVDGPFKSLEGAWRFQPLTSNACKVALLLDYRFDNSVLEAAIGPVFGMIADTMIERFVARADLLFGREK